MPTIITQREDLSIDLLTYGEDELAHQVLSVSDEIMAAIAECAWDFLPPSGLLAAAVVRAAIAVLEGSPREPRRKRRRLKGIYPGYH